MPALETHGQVAHQNASGHWLRHLPLPEQLQAVFPQMPGCQTAEIQGKTGRQDVQLR